MKAQGLLALSSDAQEYDIDVESTIVIDDTAPAADLTTFDIDSGVQGGQNYRGDPRCCR